MATVWPPTCDWPLACDHWQSINGLCFMLPVGASVAGATRVGAALGCGDAVGARRAAIVCLANGAFVGTCSSIALLTARHSIVAAFTSDAGLRAVLADSLLPMLSVYVLADALQYCCNGVLQGCGRQRQAFPLCLAAYYLVGLPLSAGIGFGAGWGVQGMVLGMCVGKVCHVIAFGSLVGCTRWEEQVRRAAERVGAEATPAVLECATSTADADHEGSDGPGAQAARVARLTPRVSPPTHSQELSACGSVDAEAQRERGALSTPATEDVAAGSAATASAERAGTGRSLRACVAPTTVVKRYAELREDEDE